MVSHPFSLPHRSLLVIQVAHAGLCHAREGPWLRRDVCRGKQPELNLVLFPALKMTHRQRALAAPWAVSTTSRQMRPVTSDVLSRKSKLDRLDSADWPQPRLSPRYSLLRLTYPACLLTVIVPVRQVFGGRFVLLTAKRKNVPFVPRLNKTVSCDGSRISRHVLMIPKSSQCLCQSTSQDQPQMRPMERIVPLKKRNGSGAVVVHRHSGQERLCPLDDHPHNVVIWSVPHNHNL